MSDQADTQSQQPSLHDPNSKYSKESVEAEDYDSGILSGPLSTFSRPLDQPKKDDHTTTVTHTDTFFDSGLIDDRHPSAKSTSQMFLDNEHLGVTDKLSNLHLETSKSLNNLSQTKDAAKQQPTAIVGPLSTQEDVSKLCYMQNDEGYT